MVFVDEKYDCDAIGVQAYVCSGLAQLKNEFEITDVSMQSGNVRLVWKRENICTY